MYALSIYGTVWAEKSISLYLCWNGFLKSEKKNVKYKTAVNSCKVLSWWRVCISTRIRVVIGSVYYCHNCIV
jgi:hypothetical protein